MHDAEPALSTAFHDVRTRSEIMSCRSRMLLQLCLDCWPTVALFVTIVVLLAIQAVARPGAGLLPECISISLD